MVEQIPDDEARQCARVGQDALRNARPKRHLDAEPEPPLNWDYRIRQGTERYYGDPE